MKNLTITVFIIILLFDSCISSKIGYYQRVNDNDLFTAFILELKKDNTFKYYQYRAPQSSVEQGVWSCKGDSILLNSNTQEEGYGESYDHSLRRFKNEYFLFRLNTIFISIESQKTKIIRLQKTKQPYRGRFNR
jgi:hypothetical protein